MNREQLIDYLAYLKDIYKYVLQVELHNEVKFKNPKIKFKNCILVSNFLDLDEEITVNIDDVKVKVLLNQVDLGLLKVINKYLPVFEILDKGSE